MASSNQLKIDEATGVLRKYFDTKDVRKLQYFLGLDVAYSNESIFLCQREYVLDLLRDTRLIGIRDANIPMEINLKLCGDDGEPTTNITSYQQLIGKLIYLTTTRLDIT